MERVAFVTGASSGFGLLTSVRLAGSGYRVVATMRDLNRRGALLEAAERAGVANRIETMRLDVAEPDGIENAVEEALRRFGPIRALVNNAGFAVGGPIEEIETDVWRRQMETNFFGLVAVTRAFLPSMRERGDGVVVNVGSVSGKIAFPGYGPYAASKFAVEGFSESLRMEMAPFGVKVVLVEPGAYRTAIWDKGLADIRVRPDSPYSRMLEGVIRYSRRAGETAPDPQEVADLIGRLVDHPSPRLRYALGQGSRLALWSKALLPWKTFEAMIGRLLR